MSNRNSKVRIYIITERCIDEAKAHSIYCVHCVYIVADTTRRARIHIWHASGAAAAVVDAGVAAAAAAAASAVFACTPYIDVAHAFNIDGSLDEIVSATFVFFYMHCRVFFFCFFLLIESEKVNEVLDMRSACFSHNDFYVNCVIFKGLLFCVVWLGPYASLVHYIVLHCTLSTTGCRSSFTLRFDCKATNFSVHVASGGSITK